MTYFCFRKKLNKKTILFEVSFFSYSLIWWPLSTILKCSSKFLKIINKLVIKALINPFPAGGGDRVKLNVFFSSIA